MPRKILISVSLLLVFVFLLIFSLIPSKPELSQVHVSLESGETGNISIEIPDRVWAGEFYPLRAGVQINISGFSKPVTLVGKMESSVEEVDPRGEIRLRLDAPGLVTLEWQMRPYRKSTYPGVLWLWLEMTDGKQLLLARDFTLDAHNFLGLRMSTLRIILGQIILLCLLVVFYSIVMYKKRKEK